MDPIEIADRLTIGQLLARYADAIDRKDWDALDTVFTEDAHIDYSSTGGPEAAGDWARMKPWLRSSLALFPRTQHLLGQSVVDLDGDRAVCRTAFTNPLGAPVDADGGYDADGTTLHFMTCAGWYRDECTRTADGWRISSKVIEDPFFQGSLPRFG